MKRFSIITAVLLGVLIMIAGVACESDSTNWQDIGAFVAPARVQGARYNVPETGKYRFVILDGAYGFTPAATEWYTQVWIYRNRPIQWVGGVANPPAVNPDAKVGNITPYPNPAQATAHGIGRDVALDLQKGDSLLFAVPDNRGWYGDNPGNISFSVQRAQ